MVYLYRKHKKFVLYDTKHKRFSIMSIIAHACALLVLKLKPAYCEKWKPI